MSAINKELNRDLFLVEFLVNSIRVDTNVIDADHLDLPTTVEIKFNNMATIEIYQKDRQKNTNISDFSCGKSLMFALPPNQENNVSTFGLEAKIVKVSPTDRFEVGKTKICLIELFSSLFQEMEEAPGRYPYSKMLKDTFMVMGENDKPTGMINLWVRLSCMGNNIVTAFQCGQALNEEVLIQNEGGQEVYMCKPVEQGQDIADNRQDNFEGDLDQHRGGDVANTKRDGQQVVLDVLPNASRCVGDHNIVEYKITNENGTVRVIPVSKQDPQRTKDGRTKTQVKTDVNKNVFVLRVGNKSTVGGKMELELKTPKQVVQPVVLPPYHEDVYVQTQKEKKGGGKSKKK